MWKGRGIGRVCRAGGGKSEERAGVVVRREVSHGGAGRVPNAGAGDGAWCAGGARAAGEVGGVELEGFPRGGRHSFFPVFGRRCCGRCRADMAAAFLLAAAGAAGGAGFYICGRCCGRCGLLYLRRVLRAGRALSNCLASLHVCFVPLRLFDPCGGRVAATAHVRHKSGKSGFPAVAESAFLLFVYLRYFCRDTAPATGSNSS